MILFLIMFLSFSWKAVCFWNFFNMMTTLTVKEHSKLEEERKGKGHICVVFCAVKDFSLVSSITEL